MPLIPWRKKTVTEQPKQLSPWEAFRSELNRWFEDMEREIFGGGFWPSAVGGFVPPVDVSEDEKHIVVRAEVPGLRPEDLELSVSGNQLTLTGEKREARESRSAGVYQSECRYGRFVRLVELPGAVDPEKVEAELANGVLTVKLTKLGETAGRRIPIKVR
ncbi:MAG: Hsp20/alpha crystallin family protein [Thermoguttaceae bacterium]|nr:Hsp20/alpha crystallin family protein [Thermoguttaceae bacterium]MDW8079243.1 Hsp20/alpha crystallin family protein [Thermoguttaceae bacterium]